VLHNEMPIRRKTKFKAFSIRRDRIRGCIAMVHEQKSAEREDRGSWQMYLSRSLVCIILAAILVLSAFPAAALEDLRPVPGLSPAMPANLTPAEIAWVQEHHVIHVCIDPSYTPIEFQDSGGTYSGLSLDYLRRAGESTGLHFAIEPVNNWNVCIDRIQKKEVDLLSAVYISDLRKDYLLFTRPYYKNALVIVTKNDVSSGLSLEKLSGKSVAVVDGYTSHLLLKERYPEINAVPVPDVETGLTKVAFGSADAYLGDLATVTYVVEKEGITNLKVSGEYAPEGEGPLQFAFGVRNDQPMLVSILNKGLSEIPPEDNAVIVKRWISSSLVPVPGLDPHVYLSLLAGIVVILAIVIIILLLNRTLKHQVAAKTAELVTELEQRRRTEQALRESEQRNAAILAAIPDLLFILSRNGEYLDIQASGEAAKTIPAGFAIGSTLADAGFEPSTAGLITRAIGRALDSGKLETVSYDLATPLGQKSFETRLIRLDPDRVLGVVQDVTEQKRMQESLHLARSKMGILNAITFQDIQAGIFSLSAYVELLKKVDVPEERAAYLNKEAVILTKISGSLKFAQDYQDLGMTPPRWQNVQQVFLYAISHLDLRGITRNGSLEGLDIYADPLLEKAFFRLVESILTMGGEVSCITLGYTVTDGGLVMTVGDNGKGISEDEKDRIFERDTGKTPVPGLFLVRQILSITGISIHETGQPGRGARFEILVPDGAYRFVPESQDPGHN
jgi:ABC-type amino acid transport substrate-binding protein/signal transduction histidine kinase